MYQTAFSQLVIKTRTKALLDNTRIQCLVQTQLGASLEPSPLTQGMFFQAIGQCSTLPNWAVLNPLWRSLFHKAVRQSTRKQIRQHMERQWREASKDQWNKQIPWNLNVKIANVNNHIKQLAEECGQYSHNHYQY